MKNKKNLFLTIYTIILLPLLLTGCFNYHDINKVTFPTSVIFDINDLGEAVIYLDCIEVLMIVLIKEGVLFIRVKEEQLWKL